MEDLNREALSTLLSMMYKDLRKTKKEVGKCLLLLAEIRSEQTGTDVADILNDAELEALETEIGEFDRLTRSAFGIA